MPTNKDEVAVVEALFGPPENIISTYHLLGPTGILSQVKPNVIGPMAARAAAAAAKDMETFSDDEGQDADEDE